VFAWAVVCSQLFIFIAGAAAQEPTTEPTPLNTPTPAPTWTPTPTQTPDPAATPTASASSPTPTTTGRLVDFRVDDEEIEPGNCVTFSWIVRGDIDRVEFDIHDDGKVPVLVSNMDSREECPTEETEYELVASWLDGSRTARSITVNMSSGGGSNNGSGGSGATATPGGTSVFVAVTPILLTGTPISAPTEGGAAPQGSMTSSAGAVVVTPVGALGSVSTLPETGYLAPAAEDAALSDRPVGQLRPGRASGLAEVAGAAFLGLACLAAITRKREASR
jgi:hypothetical protein